MAGISVAGSNIDVRGLVSQLMSIERRPLNMSQVRVDNFNSQLSALGKLKSDISAFQTSIRALSSGTFLNAFKATTTDATVANATANSEAKAGTYEINVSKLAKAQAIALAGQSNKTSGLGGAANTLNFSFQDGTTKSVALDANLSLEGIRDAINRDSIGVSATIVNTGDPAAPHRLVVSSSETGSNKSFTTSIASADTNLNFLAFNGTAGVGQTLTAAQNAELTVNGLAVSGQTNKLSDAITGVDLTVSKVGTANISVARDDEAVLASVQNFVDAYNKVAATTKSMYSVNSVSSGVDSEGKPLPALKRLDYSMLSITNRLQGVITTGLEGANASTEKAFLTQIGVSFQKDGTLSLNKETFKKAVGEDLASVQKLFGNAAGTGVADKLNLAVNELLGPQGVVESRTDSINSMMKYENMQQDRIQARLTQVEKRYMSQFSALDAALSKINSMSAYLAKVL